MDDAPIKIWPFYEAPLHLQQLSDNGGDEDWLAVIPSAMETPWFMEEGSAFGCCSSSRYECDGFSVIIGSHA